MSDVFDKLIEGAEKLGVAAKEYAQASVIFYQQGLSADEVQRRTDITIKAAKAAGQSMEEMSEQLTAVWNTYQMSGDRLVNAASIASKLGAETAVDFKYIAEAMQISASAASQLGASYESLTSIIATVGETSLQSASVVGNAYKTIFSRLTNLKETGEDEGVTLGQISARLDKLGVSALDAEGNLRNLDDIIMQLGTSWDTYSTAQQKAIAEIVGGVRQYGQFLSLMNNFDKYLRNLQSATGETGSESLEEQYAVWSESIEAAAERAANAWGEAFAQIFEQDSIKNFYSVITNVG